MSCTVGGAVRINIGAVITERPSVTGSSVRDDNDELLVLRSFCIRIRTFSFFIKRINIVVSDTGSNEICIIFASCFHICNIINVTCKQSAIFVCIIVDIKIAVRRYINRCICRERGNFLCRNLEYGLSCCVFTIDGLIAILDVIIR